MRLEREAPSRCDAAGGRRRAPIFALAIVVACSLAVPAATSHHPSRADTFGYKLAPGPWPVNAVRRLVLKDQQRKKNVQVSVRYPRAKGALRRPTFPLVVFSQGAGASADDFPDLTAHWASHGYVVIVPAHADSEPVGRRRRDARRTFDVTQLDRLADVVFVLDSLDQVEKKMDGFHGRKAMRIDRDAIGIAGHAAGALTAQMAIGVKVRLARESGEPELKSVGDPRFKAAIVISGQGTISRMLTAESWTDLAKPLLVITGSRDVVPASRETPETRQEPFLLARPGQKYLVFIDGATHLSYAGKPGAAEGPDVSEIDLRMITSVTASATLVFWDAYLQNDQHAREYLASEDLSRFAGGKVTLKRK